MVSSCRARQVDLSNSPDTNIGSSIMKALQRSVLCSAHIPTRLLCCSSLCDHRPWRVSAAIQATNAGFPCTGLCDTSTCSRWDAICGAQKRNAAQAEALTLQQRTPTTQSLGPVALDASAQSCEVMTGLLALSLSRTFSCPRCHCFCLQCVKGGNRAASAGSNLAGILSMPGCSTQPGGLLSGTSGSSTTARQYWHRHV